MDERSIGDKGKTSALYVWNGVSLFWGSSFNTNPHKHETLQLVFDLKNEFLLRDNSGEWNSYHSAIIRNEHLHQFDSNGGIQLFLYLDKDTRYAQELIHQYLVHQNINDISHHIIDTLGTAFFKELLINPSCQRLFEGSLKIIDHLMGASKSIQTDPRIANALKYIKSNSKPALKVAEIAEHICLSESRFRHLFKLQMGQSIQNYILWTKVISSIDSLLKGHKLSHVAYESGFWDGSHMDKAYKTLLGISPGSIQQYSDQVEIIPCADSNFYIFRTEISKNWSDLKPNVIEL